MDSSFNSEVKEKQGQTPNSQPAPVSDTASIIEKADAVAKRMEEANKKAEELLQKQESILARNMLSGRTEAGQAPVKLPEISPQEYARKVLKGEINPFVD